MPQAVSATPSRILSPDFARGLTLLGIAGANLATAWAPVNDAPLASLMGGVVDGSVADKIAVMIGAMFLHVRGLPMFATLLGFGIGLISMSLYRRQYPLAAARKLIAKRYGFLALFGLVHCIFMFYGDIMLGYGLIGMLLALCIAVRDKPLLISAAVLMGLNLLLFLALGVAFLFFSDAMSGNALSAGGILGTGAFSEQLPWIDDSYWGQLFMGAILAVATPFSLPQLIMMIGPLMLIGFVAARRGVLTDVETYRRWLQISAGVALGVMVCIGVPLGLAGIGVLPKEWELGLFMLNQGFGIFTGPGIVAMIALAAEPLQRRLNEGGTLPAPLVAVQALGKRSMSGYVLQSLLCMIFVTNYSLGIGQGKGAADTLAIAAVIWLVSVVLAYALELLGKKGPLEYLHRRLSYGHEGLPQVYQPVPAQR